MRLGPLRDVWGLKVLNPHRTTVGCRDDARLVVVIHKNENKNVSFIKIKFLFLIVCSLSFGCLILLLFFFHFFFDVYYYIYRFLWSPSPSLCHVLGHQLVQMPAFVSNWFCRARTA